MELQISANEKREYLKSDFGKTTVGEELLSRGAHVKQHSHLSSEKRNM
jgi:hypothetical protein